MFYLTGIAIDFFLMLILFSKRDKSDADKILAIWLFCIGLHLTFFYLFVSGQFIQYPQLLGLEIPFPLLHGPFLFLYTSFLTNQITKGIKNYLHFLPFVLAYLPLGSFLLSSNEHKIFTYQNQGAGYESIMMVKNIALIISGIVYVTLSIHKLNRHRKNITNQFSNIDKINLAWLRYLILGMSCIWIVVIFIGKDEYIFATVVLYVFFIGFFGIKQTGIFSHNQPLLQDEYVAGNSITDDAENPEFVEPEIDSISEKGKYLKSGLNEDEIHLIHNKLTSLMKQQRLYTNPELTLGDTAQQLNVHPNYLSQVINSITKKNFYDYINFQRVEEFNRVVTLPENQKYTLLSLAYECGFNSKTSFNRNFRKVTGLSPSEYLKQINVSLTH